MAARSTIIHLIPADRERPIIKCKCRSFLTLPLEGVLCPCGRTHLRKESLPGTVREKTIENA